MKNRVSIIFILLVINSMLSSCSSIMSASTKNWKKELINSQTPDSHVVIKANLSTGCPQSRWKVSQDSIFFENGFLPIIIRELAGKTVSRTDFVNMKIQEKLKLDIHYKPNKVQDLKLSSDTLMHLLAKKMKFSISLDSILKKVYTVKIIDSIKLKRHYDNVNKDSNIRTTKTFIAIQGLSLPSVFETLEDQFNTLIEYSVVNEQNYKMLIPKNNFQNMMLYFKYECGMEFIETTKKVEIAKVIFQDLK